MRLHYPLNSNGAEDAGQLPWTDGVPATGVEGSYPGHAIVTDAEAEILAAIDGGGFVRSGTDLTQLLQAISRGLWLGVFGGTSTALTATLPNSIVLPSLQAGMRVRGIAASNYTGSGGTLAITGVGAAGNTVSYPLVGSDGVTALASGAWTAGQFLTFEIDASGNARFGGGGAGATNVVQSLNAAPINAFIAPQVTNTVPSGVTTQITAFGSIINNVPSSLGSWDSVNAKWVAAKGLWVDIGCALMTNLPIANYGFSLSVGLNNTANNSIVGFSLPATASMYLGPFLSVKMPFYLNAGDYLRLYAGHNYGSNLNVPARLTIEPRGL